MLYQLGKDWETLLPNLEWSRCGLVPAEVGDGPGHIPPSDVQILPILSYSLVPSPVPSTVASSCVNSINVHKGLESFTAMRKVDLKHFLFFSTQNTSYNVKYDVCYAHIDPA